MGKNQHVVPRDGNWAVKSEGAKRASSIHDTQNEAIKAAREIAHNQSSELFIDGRIRERDSEGHDPYPPKG
jgi:uncharacterized protein YdaT